LDFGLTLSSGTLNLDYVFTGAITSNSYLSSAYSFGGDINRSPFVDVSGAFDLSAMSPLNPPQRNRYDFILNLNNSAIRDVCVDIIFHNTAGDEIDFYVYNGSGSASGNSFSINLANGNLQVIPFMGTTTNTALTGTLTGNFDSSTPNVGSRVVPGSTSRFTPTYLATPPALAPSTIPIADGVVTKAGS
jgi:hypothetical protein